MPGIPLLSDRSAFDVDGYPEKHASDLAASLPVHHVPAGTVNGQTLQWDGTKWITTTPASSDTPLIMTLGTKEGNLSVISSPFKIYNRYGTDRIITEVFLSVAIAPTGDDVIVNVDMDGSSIFTGGNEATILATELTGFSITIASPTWAIGSYIEWDILQVGTTLPGSDLVVHIVSEPAPSGS